MNHYKVLVLAVNGKRGIFRSGDEVNEDNFPPGHAEKLVEQGYLERIGEDEQKPVDQNGQPEFVVPEVLSIDKVTLNQMKAELSALKIEYPKNGSKAELFEIWKVIKK